MKDPLFQHDCDACTFLGTVDRRDCYICMQGKEEQMYDLIGRFGNKGEEYSSSLLPEAFSAKDEYLLTAPRWYLFTLLSAIRKGLISSR